MLLNKYSELTLFITNNHVNAYLSDQALVEPIGRWPLEIEGILQDALIDFLETHKHDVFTIVVDIAEEEFTQELIPKLGRSDTKAMVLRKLAQKYREADYRLSYPLEKPKLRDWNKNKSVPYMFTALTQITPLEGILKQLQKQQSKLRGVYTSTFLSTIALKLLKETGDTLLFVEHQDTLRQILIVDSNVRFARLAQISDVDSSSFYDEEFNRIIQYLQIGRLIDREILNTGQLSIVVLSRRTPVSLKATWPSGAALNVKWYKPEEIIRDTKKKHYAIGAYGIEWIYAISKLRQHCLTYFKPQQATRFWKISQFKQNLDRSTLAVLLVGFIFAGYAYSSITDQEKIASDNRLQASVINKRYEDIKSLFPSLPVPPEELRTKVDLMELITSRGTHPEVALGLISSIFDEFSDLRITKLSWANGENQVAIGGNDSRAVNPVQSVSLPQNVEKAIGLPASGGGQTPALHSVAEYAEEKPKIITIEGLVAPTKPITKQEANQLVSLFEERLQTKCLCKTSAQLPFDVSPDGLIVDQFGQHGEKIAPAKFILKIKLPRRSHAG